jgi:hypothetical protein
MLSILTQQATMDPYVWEIVSAFFILATFSVLWKANPFFKATQQIVIGIVTAFLLLFNITLMNTSVFSRIVAGESLYIISLIWGIAQYTYFSQPLRGIYRGAIVASLTISLGTTINKVLALLWVSMKGISWGMTDTLLLTNVLVGAFAFIYHIYWKAFEDRFSRIASIPRMLYRFSFASYCGWVIGSVFCLGRGLNQVIDQAFYVVRGVGAGGVGLYVLFIGLIVIVIDAVVGWNKILGRSPAKVEVSP